ncbi:MAG: UDP-glucose:(heptosyl)LPS alpha-1 3-glucosyltransferase [Nitrospirae bacterium]|nr:MAG: UDP-glucose:(heptosyl)LPS alpha-1 3-glucosyltransferase [Nitrospirota bacterium]
MRLAFIKKKFSLYGGAERYMQTLLMQLAKEGHELHIFAHEWTPTDGITIHTVPIRRTTSYFSTITFARNVARMVSEAPRFDCVVSFERTICQDIYRAGEGVHRAWLDIRSQSEAWHKRLSFKLNPLHHAILSLERELFLKTPCVIANSEMVKRQIIEHYEIPPQKIAVIYNGVDLERFRTVPPDRKAELRQKLGLPRAAAIALYVGSGFRRKGVPHILKAIAKLKKSGVSDIMFVAVGKDRISDYEKCAARHGISNRVMFLGPREDVADLYAASDFFILPTLYDPFSNATLEALACGLPVITSKNNGVAELIENGVHGYVLNNLADTDELAARMSELAGNYSFMQNTARGLAERFPIEQTAAGVIGVVKSLRNV